MTNHYAADERSLHSAATMTADDEEIRGPFLCGLNYLLVGRADLKEVAAGGLRRPTLTHCSEQPLGIKCGRGDQHPKRSGRER